MARTTIVQTSFNSGELSPFMGARMDQGRYGTGCRVLRNMLCTPHGAVFRRPGLRFMGEAAVQSEAARPVRLVPFVFNEEQAYVLEFFHLGLRVWHNGGLVLDASAQPFALATPFDGEHIWNLRHCRSGDVMYLVSRNMPPCKLMRYGHADWRLETMRFGPCVAAPENVVATPTGAAERSYAYVVTAVAPDSEEESLPSQEALCTAAATLNTSNYVTLTWQAVPEAREYRVFRGGGGSGSFGLVGRSVGMSYVDRGQTADYACGVPEARDPFDGDGAYPAAVQFYQQRLCFAASDRAPQTIWAGRTGNYDNLNVSYPLQSDDACTVTLAADRVNAVRWMMPAGKLLIGTVDGEWTLSGAGGEPFSALSCEAQRHSSWGSADLPALTVGDTVLYVQRGGKVVREFRYFLDSDSFSGTDMTILAEHIFRERRIVDWSWQAGPHSVLWCVLDDGTLAALTLIKEHEVAAWHRHDTAGRVESVTVIPSTGHDEAWFVVRRDCRDPLTGNWKTVRTLERMDPPFDAPLSVPKAEAAFFVDSGLSYQGPPTTRLSGLGHLEGKEVQILADGWVHPPQVVTNGAVALKTPASAIHVGLGYVSDIAPMASELAEAQGAALGMTRRVGRVRFRLYRTLGCKVGPDAEHLRDVLFRRIPHEMGKALSLFSGDCSMLIDSDASIEGGVYFRQDDPLPFTLMAVAHELEVGEL